MGLSKGQAKLWAIALFSISTLVFGVVWQVAKDRTSALEGSGRVTQQLSLTLEASIVGGLRSAELAADHVATVTAGHLKPDGDPDDTAIAFWVETLRELNFLHGISYIKADGSIPSTAVRMDAESVQVIKRLFDGSEWPAYTMHLQKGEDRIFLGDPIRSFFVEGEWILPLTQAIRDANGDLVGVVYIDIALKTFLSLFEEVLPPGMNSVALFHDDGRLLFAYPFVDAVIGKSYKDLNLFKVRLAESNAGTYQAQSQLNRDMRVLSYRSVGGWPLVLTVDLSNAEVLAPWRKSAFAYGLAATGAATVILTLTLWLTLQFRRDDENRRTLLLKERSLEESQRLAEIGHFERDILTSEIIWGENMYAIHGVEPEEFAPSRPAFLDLVVEESREDVVRNVGAFDNPPADGHFEARICRPCDGAVRTMTYDWRIIRDQDGRAIKAFGVAQDVTDLRRTERKVRENEIRLRDITECMSDFIWEIDENGVITYFESGSHNPMLNIQIGVTKDQNIDLTEGLTDRSMMLQAMAQQEPFRNLIIALRDKQDEARWVRISANPMYDSKNTFIGYRGAGADVTEQRRQRLQQAEREKSDALDRLAGGIAHEINNLLQPVVVYSAMGETEAPEIERTQGYFRKIYMASQQAIRIVQDILTFAREGRAKVESISLSSAVKDGLDLMRPTLPSTLILDQSWFDEEVNVSANAGGVHQVLFNLVRNAVDAAGPNGTVIIETGTSVLYSKDSDPWTVLPGRYGFFSVADNGPGLDEQTLSKIFDPFFTTKPRGVGTGLGLSVVAGLVREWGGAVDVVSFKGKTTFTVFVPLVGALKQAAE